MNNKRCGVFVALVINVLTIGLLQANSNNNNQSESAYWTFTKCFTKGFVAPIVPAALYATARSGWNRLQPSKEKSFYTKEGFSTFTALSAFFFIHAGQRKSYLPDAVNNVMTTDCSGIVNSAALLLGLVGGATIGQNIQMPF